LDIVSWENSHVSGKVVIQEICERIASANIFLADVTGLNPNVMFEFGYAIGRNKRTWLVLDETVPTAKRDYERMSILRGIGYAGYTNSQNIMLRFLEDHPFTDLADTIFTKSIEHVLDPGPPSHLLYLRLNHETDAERRVSELVDLHERMGLPSVIDDPNEARVQPLTWYGQKTHAAIAVLAHFASPRREGWEAHNARYAFVSGLAHGFGIPIMMLAEADYEVPLDYQHLLVRYATARECAENVSGFLAKARQEYITSRGAAYLELRPPPLRVELKALRLGEHIAENETQQLDQYFIETAAFTEALSGRFTIFVGRKGSGKTANLFRLASELRDDPRNLVVVVKPLGYDLDGVLRLLRKYQERDTKGYMIESLWKFLLYSEIAKSSAEAIERRPRATWTSDEAELIKLMDDEPSLLRDSFAVRLERCVESVLPLQESGKVETTRTAISEALHSSLLKRMREILGRTLSQKQRIAVLVDNLDKSWTRNGEIDELSALFLGLVGAAGRLPTEFLKATYGREPMNLTLSLFVRSDIFQAVLRHAREPDKIAFSRIIWNDPYMLLRVPEQRFVASHQFAVPASELWQSFFSPLTRSMQTRDYIVSRILPRPRDIIFFMNAAISTAINRNHSHVEEDDVLEAERQYSQFALDAVIVEGLTVEPKIEEILYEFAGANAVLREDDILQLIGRVVKDRTGWRDVLAALIALSFLGLEIRTGVFEFPVDEEDLKKVAVLARKLHDTRRGFAPYYRVHNAFCSYLDIREAPSNR
jgi:molybdopterin-guanine dinucleotide biosynthesis protein